MSFIVARALANWMLISRSAAFLDLPESGQTILVEEVGGNNHKQIYSNKLISKSDMTTRLVYLPSDSSIVLTWEVFIEEVNHGHMMLVYINAESGDVQKTTSLTNECDFNLTTSQTCHNQIKSKEKLPSSTNHIKSDQPATFAPNSYLVYPIPLEAPNEGPQSAVVAPWTLAVDASPFGWHDTN